VNAEAGHLGAVVSNNNKKVKHMIGAEERFSVNKKA
jgi:hypothetical protein